MQKLIFVAFLLLWETSYSQDTLSFRDKSIIVASTATNATVMAVHDGDSYKVKMDNGETKWIRLWGVDCPEVISNHINKNQPYGVQSANTIRQLIKGKRVIVDSVTTDIYDRDVCKVWYDTINLTDYILLNGLGWWYNNSKVKPKVLDYLKAYQTQAQDSKLGLWGLPGRKTRPDKWRKSNWRD